MHRQAYMQSAGFWPESVSLPTNLLYSASSWHTCTAVAAERLPVNTASVLVVQWVLVRVGLATYLAFFDLGCTSAMATRKRSELSQLHHENVVQRGKHIYLYIRYSGQNCSQAHKCATHVPSDTPDTNHETLRHIIHYDFDRIHNLWTGNTKTYRFLHPLATWYWNHGGLWHCRLMHRLLCIHSAYIIHTGWLSLRTLSSVNPLTTVLCQPPSSCWFCLQLTFPSA